MSGNNRPVLFENHSQDGRYRGPLENCRRRAEWRKQPAVLRGGARLWDQRDGHWPGRKTAGTAPLVGYTLTARDRTACACHISCHCAAGTKKVWEPVCIRCCIIGSQNRRLTPLECERLQGFPDGWTDIPGASDTARYKPLGNSVAVPCVETVTAVQKLLTMGGKD